MSPEANSSVCWQKLEGGERDSVGMSEKNQLIWLMGRWRKWPRGGMGLNPGMPFLEEEWGGVGNEHFGFGQDWHTVYYGNLPGMWRLRPEARLAIGMWALQICHQSEWNHLETVYHLDGGDKRARNKEKPTLQRLTGMKKGESKNTGSSRSQAKSSFSSLRKKIRSHQLTYSFIGPG